MDCTNADASHPDATYGLIADGFSAQVDGDKNTSWMYVITIDVNAYAAYYDEQEKYEAGTHTATTDLLLPLS